MKNISWWKIVGFLLVLYSMIGGLLVPLGPGIERVSPTKINTGEDVTLEITGYNTHFSPETQFYLKFNDDALIASKTISVVNSNFAHATFSLPDYFPNNSEVWPLTLIMTSPIDGYALIPNIPTIINQGGEGNDAQWMSKDILATVNVSTFHFPYRNILKETIRNTYFHVTMWFAMIILFTISFVHSVRFYLKNQSIDDIKATSFVRSGVFFGILGLVTGAMWARHTWGAYWSWDVKQNMAGISVLIYCAYFILRNSLEDLDKKARLSAGYNIFAFATLIPLLFIIPRMSESLHPGSGGNPALGGEDLDNTMRMFFYPAIIGWTLIGMWIAQLFSRLNILQDEEQ